MCDIGSVCSNSYYEYMEHLTIFNLAYEDRAKYFGLMIHRNLELTVETT